MLRPTTTSTGHGSLENEQAAAPYDEALIDPAACSSHRTTTHDGTRFGGGFVSPVVEPASAVMTTMTRTSRTATTANTLSTTKACDEDFSVATDSSTTCATAGMSTIHNKDNLTATRECNASSIMTDKRKLAERKQQLRPQVTTNPSSGAADPIMSPGTVSVDGQGNNQHGELDYSLESPIDEVSSSVTCTGVAASTRTQTLSLSNTTHLLSAKLVNDDEILQRAEAAMRLMAQAEFQRMMEEAAVAQATPVIVDDNEEEEEEEEEEKSQHIDNTKLQTRRRCIMIACSILVVVMVSVIVAAVVLSDTGRGQGGANTMDAVTAADIKTPPDNETAAVTTSPADETAVNGPTPGPTNSPTVVAPPADEMVANGPTPGPTYGPTVAATPADEAMAVFAPPIDGGSEQQQLAWLQVGNDIGGMEVDEKFGEYLSFSADGNTIVGSAQVWKNENRDAVVGQVCAYSYQEEDSSDWKQLGQNITGDLEIDFLDELSLSPNGKYLAVCTSPESGAHFVRVFALEKVEDNATEDSASAVIWKQIGSDLYSPLNLTGFCYSISLLDSLILAVSEKLTSVFIYRFDTITSDWVPMGQTIEGPVDDDWFGNSLQLAINNNGTVILAIGGTDQVHVYRFNKDIDEIWVDISKTSSDGFFGGAGALVGALVGLSRDASTLAVGVWADDDSWAIDVIRVLSLDTETDDWLQLGKDIQDPSLFFGKSSLSANGTVLVTATTIRSDIIYDVYVTGEVRIWDYVGCHGGGDDSGEWIQRVSFLEASPGISFGEQVALSSDGSRLAISAPLALNNQGIKTGELYVFAVANTNATVTMTQCATTMSSGSLLHRGLHSSK